MTPEQKIEQLERKIEKLEKVSADADFYSYKTDSLNSQYQVSPQFSNNNIHGELELIEVCKIIWEGRWKVVVLTSIFAFLSILYAISLPNMYRSEALLVPNSKEQSSGGLSALAGQFGGLASLAGLNLGGSGIDKTGYALQVLKSREFIYKFIQDNNLKVVTMASKGWSRETNTIIFDENLYDARTEAWVRDVKPPFKPEPSLHETYEHFLNENLTVFKDEETGMIKIAIEHYSPYVAKELVETLTKTINETIKQQDMSEAIKSISYLEQELKNTKLSGAQTMFYQLIEQQQQTLMLTKVRDDYVLKLVDKPIVAEEKSKPSRALICILGAMIGAMFGIVAALIFGFRNK